jgi:hypothetical protein
MVHQFLVTVSDLFDTLDKRMEPKHHKSMWYSLNISFSFYPWHICISLGSFLSLPLTLWCVNCSIQVPCLDRPMTTPMLLSLKANTHMIFQDSSFRYLEFSICSIIPVTMDAKPHNDRICWPDGYCVLLLWECFTMDTAVYHIGALDLALNKTTLYSYCAEIKILCMSWWFVLPVLNQRR